MDVTVFAEFCGWSYYTQWRIENGRQPIKPKHIKALSKTIFFCDWPTEQVEGLFLEESDNYWFEVREMSYNDTYWFIYYHPDELERFWEDGYYLLKTPYARYLATSSFASNYPGVKKNTTVIVKQWTRTDLITPTWEMP